MPGSRPGRPAVAIAHDYLTQRGGAERVVLTLLEAFPDAVVHTTLYDAEGTYPQFRDARIVTSPLNRVGPLRRHHRAALPLLAPAASRLRVDADVTVVSSSGWAHGFDIRGRRLVYCYSPARWLYQTDDYLGAGRRGPAGLAVGALRRPLVAWDQRAARAADRYLAISRVVQDRIRSTYGIEADVVPAPHSMDAAGEADPVPELADWAAEGYLLLVSRLLPYKNVDKVVDAVATTGHRLVVVGRGPEEAALRARSGPGVRFLSGLSDAQLRWIYAHARLLVAPSVEDFGLTPLEAATFGVPTVALRGGGYLDTIVEHRTGEFFDDSQPAAIRAAVRRAEEATWSREALQLHASAFTAGPFVERIREEVAQLSSN
ncbi:glycosyltransferase [Nocardioides bigeumensis]|uniref:Glycosyltransferase n=1 Tax=Nocardioides bigeumensis TaxID=433657 RepID=A0ABN2YHU1_9ACTN